MSIRGGCRGAECYGVAGSPASAGGARRCGRLPRRATVPAGTRIVRDDHGGGAGSPVVRCARSCTDRRRGCARGARRRLRGGGGGRLGGRGLVVGLLRRLVAGLVLAVSLLLRRLVVRLGEVALVVLLEVRLVPAVPLQPESRRRDQAAQRGLAALGTVDQRWFADLLQSVQRVAAFLAGILINGHASISPFRLLSPAHVPPPRSFLRTPAFAGAGGASNAPPCGSRTSPARSLNRGSRNP